MRNLLLVLTLLFPLRAADLETEIATQAQAARSILDPWHADNPARESRILHLVYWTPSDRAPAADYHARLTRMMEHIRNFYGREMKRLGFGPRTFNLAYDEEKKLIIHLVTGTGAYADYNMQSGKKIRGECLPVLRKAGIIADRETMVIFCNMAEWDAQKLVFKHRSPYYAGGSHRQGTAWQLDSPELDPLHLSRKKPLIRDGQYGRISLGKHNSIFIGGVAHELGHALSLPHNKERPDERAAQGTALMGSGNRSYGDELRAEGKGSFLTLAHGLRLASHPQFSGSVKGMEQRSDLEMTDFKAVAESDEFIFSGRLKANPPVYAVIAYADPEGGSDYDATTATAVPDKDGRFTLRCRGLAKGKRAAFRLVACHVNGASSPSTRYSFSYSVGKDGKVDLAAMQERFALAPLLSALKSRDEKAATAAFKVLQKEASDGSPGRTERIGRNLLSTMVGPRRTELHPPARIEAGVRRTALANTKPMSAKVGWQRPAYNHLPGPTLLLESGSRLWEHGIYAHAPARHLYQLSGKWQSLSGAAGVADGYSGSVVFVIKADRKPLWRSKTIKAGTIVHYDLTLAGAMELELHVEDAGDGAASDWGLWLEPLLSR
ncbi:MAG: NPCBM/NEW2 domain-containing protein [Akkermansiaceae bacterium]